MPDDKICAGASYHLTPQRRVILLQQSPFSGALSRKVKIMKDILESASATRRAYIEGFSNLLEASHQGDVIISYIGKAGGKPMYEVFLKEKFIPISRPLAQGTHFEVLQALTDLIVEK